MDLPRSRWWAVACAAILAPLALLAGCADGVRPPTRPAPLDPETELTYAPADHDSAYFRVHLYWSGSDRDGEVVAFRFAADADTAAPVTAWRTTTAHDTTLDFLVDPILGVGAHAFMISAVDDAGRFDRTPARRVFSSTTLPPTSRIDRGPAAFNPRVGPAFTFEMSGIDPDGIDAARAARVDSFETLLLPIGYAREPGHPPLPAFEQALYVDLVNRATGAALPPPFDDWKWTGMRGGTKRLQDVSTGEYVFAERAVDVAGAVERSLRFVTNIRHFSVLNQGVRPGPVGPTLTINADVALSPLVTAVGPAANARPAVQLMEGETVSFSWVASADSYAARIAGYTYALDDTSRLPALAPGNLGATYSPAQLTAGTHTLYVRAVDDLGQVTNAVVPLFMVHAAFRDPGAPREVLYVDDSLSPGGMPGRVGNFPSDGEESEWWTLEALPTLGVPYAEWDTYLAGQGDVVGRKPPELRDLARYSTVIWNVDFNNSVAAPTALYTTLVGGPTSALAGYLRAGGTLILTGFALGGHTCEPRSVLYSSLAQGICAGVPPSAGVAYEGSYFPRSFMGIDGARAGDAGLRTLGARDFVAAAPTGPGLAAGYDTARVDRGPAGSGAKWITYPGSGLPNTNRSPGLPQIDGWNLARDFGCEGSLDPVFAPEDPMRPVAEAVLTYRGVPMGEDEEGAPSPREGMVVGVQVQAHRARPLAAPGYGPGFPFDPRSSVGRAVFLGFPLYFLRDEDAARVLRSAFAYVNASPTLP